MAKKKIIGTCALCSKENTELKNSHIIPKLVYNRAKMHCNSRFRSFYDPKLIFQDGEKKYMLCHDCEEFFSKYETKFTDYLDEYLQNPSTKILKLNPETNFYILTVAWRVLYDDLYVQHSYAEDLQKAQMIEYEQKLKRYLYEMYLKENPEKKDDRVIEKPNLDKMSFGELIAELEKYQKSQKPEDISEIKNYCFTLSGLGYPESVVKMFDSMVFGYSFYDSMPTRYYVVTGYKGLIITTVYRRKKNIFLTMDKKLLEKIRYSDKAIKKDIVKEVNSLIDTIRKEYPEVQKKLEESGLKEKIAARYQDEK